MNHLTYTVDIEQGPNLRRLVWRMRLHTALCCVAGFVGGVLAWGVLCR